MVSQEGLEPPISSFAGRRLFHLDHWELFGAPGRNQTCFVLRVKEVARHLPSGAYLMEPPNGLAPFYPPYPGGESLSIL